DEIARVSVESRELETRGANTDAKAGMAEAARRATGERIGQTGAVLTNVRRQTEAENEILNRQRSEAAAAAERRRSTSSDLRRLEAERDDVTARLTRHNQEIGEGATRVEELRGSITEIDRLAASVDEEKAREENQIAQATMRLTEARERADAL